MVSCNITQINEAQQRNQLSCKHNALLSVHRHAGNPSITWLPGTPMFRPIWSPSNIEPQAKDPQPLKNPAISCHLQKPFHFIFHAKIINLFIYFFFRYLKICTLLAAGLFPRYDIIRGLTQAQHSPNPTKHQLPYNNVLRY